MSDKHYTHHDDRTHLESALRKTVPWFEANATFLIYGLAAVLAVAAAVVWVRRQPQENSEVSALWMDAEQPEDFQNIADEHGGTSLGRLARLQQADSLLNSAIRKSFTDRAAANLELEQADAALNRLTDLGDLDSSAAERVLIGKARLAEVRCDGTAESMQSVIAAWQAILDYNDASIAKEMVERRIARLGTPEAAEFYVWFHALDPKPEDDLTAPGMPGSALPGPGTSVPAIPSGGTPLDLPSFNFGTSDSSETADEPATDSSESNESSADTPDASDEPSDGDATAGEDNSEEASDSAEDSADPVEESSDSPAESDADE